MFCKVENLLAEYIIKSGGIFPQKYVASNVQQLVYFIRSYRQPESALQATVFSRLETLTFWLSEPKITFIVR